MSILSENIVKYACKFDNLYETVPNTKWSSHSASNSDELSKELIRIMKAAGWQTPWPYCMGFSKGVWLECIDDAEKYAKVKKLLTPSVMVTFHNCKKLVTLTPRPGAIFLMQKGSSGNGHAGIVKSVGNGVIETIEGNTSPAPTSADRDREGDGVYIKSRKLNFVASKTGLWMRGFIHPDDF